MKKRNLILGLLIATIFFGGTITIGFPQVTAYTMCPVMPGERAKEKFYVDYQGKRIYLCCRHCMVAFKRHPEKYLKNLKEG